MRMNKFDGACLGLILAFAMTACTDDGGSTDDEVGDDTESTSEDGTDDTTDDTTEDTTDDATEDAETTETETDTTGGAECPQHDPIEGAAVGEACSTNEDCSTQVCLQFQASPPVEGTCEETPADCNTRIYGRVLDFASGEVVEGIEVRAEAALTAAGDPEGAAGLISATSDANGQFDATSTEPLAAPIGLVALTSGEGYFITATGLASPVGSTEYGPATTQRDIWAVPEASLTEWSGFLEADPEFENYLPLGVAGGVVGRVRDLNTGDPVAGAVVVPTDPDSSNAVLRYLNEAGDGFTDTETSSNGIFVLIQPGLGEEFDVEIGGVAQDLVARAGSATAGGAIFTLIFNATP